MRTMVVLACLALAGCAGSQKERLSPRMAAYKELHKGMSKLEVAKILRGSRRARVVQMGDQSDPSDDLEYWYYSQDPENDYVVFTWDGKLLEWEYHYPAQALAPR